MKTKIRIFYKKGYGEKMVYLTPNEFGGKLPSNVEECAEMMLFTGIKDKTGKDIYEGDIIKKDYGCSVPIFSVAYHDERAMFIQHDGYNSPLCELTPQHIEIIGNIYENVGLLAVTPNNTKPNSH